MPSVLVRKSGQEQYDRPGQSQAKDRILKHDLRLNVDIDLAALLNQRRSPRTKQFAGLIEAQARESIRQRQLRPLFYLSHNTSPNRVPVNV